MQGRRDYNSSNDVSSNEEFETKQDRAAHILPVKRIIIARLMCTARGESRRGNQHSTCNNENPYAIHACADHFMIRLKDSMSVFITGKRGEFQCCFCCEGACAVERLL